MQFQEYVVNVEVAVGATIGTSVIKLPTGKLLGVLAFVQSAPETGLFLNAVIKDDAGVSINKATDIRSWAQRNGGSFHQSYKPINTELNGLTYTFEVSTGKNGVVPVATQYIQFVLIYDKSTNKC